MKDLVDYIILLILSSMAAKQVNIILDFKTLYYVYRQNIGNMYKKKFGYFMESTMYPVLK